MSLKTYNVQTICGNWTTNLPNANLPLLVIIFSNRKLVKKKKNTVMVNKLNMGLIYWP